MQVFVKFSVGLDAVELLKQIDELGESRFKKTFIYLSCQKCEKHCPI